MTSWNSTLPARRKPLRKTPLAKRSRKAGGVQYRLAKCKKAMFEKWGRDCAVKTAGCLSHTGYSGVVDMAHIFSIGSHPHLRYEPLNHLPCCRICHDLTHQYPAWGLRVMLSKLTPAERDRLAELARGK